MLNANIKKVIPLLIALALLFITGCSSPNEKRAKSLAEAAQLQAAGDSITALELLEALSQLYPDDSEILQQIGLIHQGLGNHSEAAFYLGAAHNLSPSDPELLYQAYLAHENADQPDPARDLLEGFSKASPTAMTNTLWFRLGELNVQAQRTETALEAYLEGIKLTNGKPSAEIALAIGTLFKQLNNLPMAGRWLVIAANGDDSNALPALFGILEIHIRSKSWEAAEKSIALLDKKFPGAVDASEWGPARGELKKWRAAQSQMQAQLEKLAQAEATKQNETLNKPVVSSTDTPPRTSGKAQAFTDMANAEALANTPASETESAATPETSITQTESTEPVIVFNPNIIIQPAEPDTDLDNETVEQSDPQILVDYAPVDQSNENTPEPLPEPDASLADTTPLSLEELIAHAEEATSKRDYEDAIRFYWDALGRTNNRADIWNALSKVYLINGQAKNAATTALEATRLATENIQYVLDYLRVVQRVKRPADFIKELEIAYDRFPRSPEITLSLARGYRRVGGNDYAAGILYRRFIQLAPNHPLRSEAEAALASIR
ncbi:MAG: tetratricopeptide (TPR) repeat protein [Lentimonas sp.]|jgi:tetratricopeptide (TPR) repeat protein